MNFIQVVLVAQLYCVFITEIAYSENVASSKNSHSKIDIEAQGIATSSIPVLVKKKFHPMVPFAFERVQASCIEPQGRWQRYLRVIADGIAYRAALTHDPAYWSLIWEKDWQKPTVAYDSAQNAAYFAAAYVRLAHYIPQSNLAKIYCSEWLPNVLNSQLSNGYIGAGQADGVLTLSRDFKREMGACPIPRYELHSQDLILETLLREYEFGGNPNIFQAARKMGDFIIQEYLNPKSYNTFRLQTPCFEAACRSLTDLYRYTGDTNIINSLKHCIIDNNIGSMKNYFKDERPHIHAVCLSVIIQAPLTMYHYTGNKELHDMSLTGFDNIAKFALQTTGTITGSEITLKKGCRKNTEHCAVCEWSKACALFLRSEGEVRFADVAERCVHNAYFGSRSPDGLSLTYYHTMNQLYATTWTGQYLRDYEPSSTFHGEYNMEHHPRCCNSMTSKGFPQFVENAVLQTPEGELTFVFYGPSTIRKTLPEGNFIKIIQDTDYPYEDEVRFTVSLERSAEFPLRFRIPTWCRSAKLLVNGKPVDEPITPGTFARVNREWSNNDKIRLAFDFPITLDWDNSPAAGKGAAIVRGPLVYALPVKADWQYIGKEPVGPKNMKEAWNVVMSNGVPWNVALQLDVKNPEASIEQVKLPVLPDDNSPWKHPSIPIGLKVQARLLPDWTLDRISNNPCTPALPRKIKPQGESFPVTLVPFGYTQLRMTVLPIIGQSKKKEVKQGQDKTDI